MNLALITHTALAALTKHFGRCQASNPSARLPIHFATNFASASSVDHGKYPSKPLPQALSMRPAQPVRVLRFIERDSAHFGHGRLVMSGRMADVCAELDRLVAQEAMAQ